MSSPIVTIVVARETEIDVVFDQTVNSPTGRPGEGFTFRVNGAPMYASTAAIVTLSPETVRFTMSGVISNEDLVEVSFDALVANLLDATLTDAATAFTDEVAQNISNHAALLGAVCALSVIEPEVVTLVFSLPVTSILGLQTGLSFAKNGSPVTFSTVAPGQDPRQLRVTFPGGFQYRDEITFSYTPVAGDWKSAGYDIKSFVNYPCTNASRMGTPTDDYPLSSVVREPLKASRGGIDATVGIDLNLVDQQLVERYGPALVDFGGTFGVTVTLPLGVFIAQDRQPIKAGMKVTKRFHVEGDPASASIAGAEWLDEMTARISTALGVLRTKDQQVVLGLRTVRQV